MICRNCGTEIAEKALICYRCGTATTDAKYQPAAPPRASRGSLVASVLAIVLIIVFGGAYGLATDISPASRATAWVVVGVAVVIVALRAYARRR